VHRLGSPLRLQWKLGPADRLKKTDIEKLTKLAKEGVHTSSYYYNYSMRGVYREGD